jgi:glutamate carboxypeptidase
MLSIEDFAARQEEFISLLRRFVEIESPSTDKLAVDQMGKAVAGELVHLGAQVEFVPQQAAGDIIIGRWTGGQTGSPILTMCHMDTVFPHGTLDKMQFREQDGKLYGPGVEDMKGGIVMLLTVMRLLQEKGSLLKRPITAIFTGDEEIGSGASRGLIEDLARRSSLVLCLEPSLPDGELKTWRKGVGDFEVIARGRAAHAGADHQQGRNAIEELAYHIPAIQKLTDYERGTTVNVGLISGGTASNVVPEEARMIVDLRVMDAGEADRILAFLQSLHPALDGTSIEVSGGLNRPPMPRDERMIATFQKAQAIAARLGVELKESGTGGGSDANFVAPLGIPVLDGLGVQGGGAHSEREYMVLNTLPQRMAVLAALLTEW